MWVSRLESSGMTKSIGWSVVSLVKALGRPRSAVIILGAIVVTYSTVVIQALDGGFEYDERRRTEANKSLPRSITTSNTSKSPFYIHIVPIHSIDIHTANTCTVYPSSLYTVRSQSKQSNMRSPLRTVSLVASVVSLSTVEASASSSSSSSYTLEFQQQQQQHQSQHAQCSSPEAFRSAYEQVYNGLQSYLELRQYSPSQVAQIVVQSSAAQSESERSQLLKDLAAVVAAATTTSSSSSSADDSTLTFQQGHGPHHRSLRRAATTATAARECVEGSWCATVHSRFGPARRRQRRRRILEQSTKRATSTSQQQQQQQPQQPQQQQQQELESVCQWLSRQDLPGCLEGATLVCSEGALN